MTITVIRLLAIISVCAQLIAHLSSSSWGGISELERTGFIVTVIAVFLELSRGMSDIAKRLRQRGEKSILVTWLSLIDRLLGHN